MCDTMRHSWLLCIEAIGHLGRRKPSGLFRLVNHIQQGSVELVRRFFKPLLPNRVVDQDWNLLRLADCLFEIGVMDCHKGTLNTPLRQAGIAVGAGEFITNLACVLIDSDLPEHNLVTARGTQINIRPNGVVYPAPREPYASRSEVRRVCLQQLKSRRKLRWFRRVEGEAHPATFILHVPESSFCCLTEFT